MSNEILSVLEYMEKERGIPRQDMIGVIANSLRNAAQKGINAGLDLKIDINPRTGAIATFALLKVVDSVSNPKTEIHIEKAQELRPGAALGEVVEKPIELAELGRIAAQTARQAIVQRIRQFEKDRVYDEYKDQVGDVITGIVRRSERGDLIVDLGKAEAILPAKEQVPGESFEPGERIRCLLLGIEPTPRGPEVILSRANPKFVRRLFELEVTEIADGTVRIEAFAREPGYRTKMAVSSRDPKVDPVGACVGARGTRVKTIVRELGTEKIDIITWRSDPRDLLLEALKPVIPKILAVDERARKIVIEVQSVEDLKKAVGHKGQNAKLTSKLLGWKLEIARTTLPSVGLDQKKEAAARALLQIPGITEADAARLVEMGVTTPEAFEGVAAEDLTENGFDAEHARKLIEKATAYLAGRQS